MNLLERFFLVTDFLFPAKTPRSEREKLFHDMRSLSSGSADALFLEREPQEAARFIEQASELPPLVVVPVAFQERYADKPFYSAIMRVLEARGYSLFNLYAVKRKRGQILSAYALFLDKKSREAFMRRIAV